MGLHVSCEVLLGLSVEIYHAISQGLSQVLEGGGPLKHGSVESTVDLLQRLWAWEVHENEGAVA